MYFICKTKCVSEGLCVTHLWCWEAKPIWVDSTEEILIYNCFCLQINLSNYKEVYETCYLSFYNIIMDIISWKCHILPLSHQSGFHLSLLEMGSVRRSRFYPIRNHIMMVISPGNDTQYYLINQCHRSGLVLQGLAQLWAEQEPSWVGCTGVHLSW